jgi:hypothetical protein
MNFMITNEVFLWFNTPKNKKLVEIEYVTLSNSLLRKQKLFQHLCILDNMNPTDMKKTDSPIIEGSKCYYSGFTI